MCIFQVLTYNITSRDLQATRVTHVIGIATTLFAVVVGIDIYIYSHRRCAQKKSMGLYIHSEWCPYGATHYSWEY